MTIQEASEHIGASVVYRRGDQPETGEITRVSDKFVFVSYRGDSGGSKATYADDLKLL